MSKRRPGTNGQRVRGHMENKGSALYLCPGCGAFVSENASKCPKCGAALESAPDEDPVSRPAREIDQETQAEIDALELLTDEPEDDSEPVTLFLCSECGAFTGGDAVTCPNCGASMHDDDVPEPVIKPGDPDSDLLDMLVEADDSAESAANLIDDLKRIESEEDVQNFIESIPFKDPDQILEMAQSTDIGSDEADISEDLLSELELDPETPELNTKNAAPDSAGSKSETGQSGKILLDDSHSISMCPSCGAFVSESAETCNICGNSVRGGFRAAKPDVKTADDDMSDEEADSILRSVMRVKPETELDAEAGSRFQSDGSLNLCTLCGAFISKDAETCPVCGTHIEDMPEFVPSIDLAGPEQEKHGLALCPHCGAFVQEGAKECFSCVRPIPEGAALATYEDEKKADDIDKASQLLKTFLGVEKALETAPIRDASFTGLDLCPDCGAFVSALAVTCSVCGNPLFEGAAEMQDLDSQLIASELPECPHCGKEMEPGSAECSSCGLAFSESGTDAEPEITDFLDTELEKTIQELEAKAASDAATEPEVPSEPAQESQDIANMLVQEYAEPELLQEEITEETAIQSEPEFGDGETRADEELPEIFAEEAEAVSEPVEFLAAEEPQDEPQDGYHDTLMEADIPEKAVAADLSRFETASHTPKPANWSTAVYASLAALCFFAVFFIIVPVDYSFSLAIIFGTWLAMGSYFALTDRGTLFKGDLRHAGVFMAGTLVAMAVLLHWPMGLLNSGSGMMGQPNLDRIVLSVSVLLMGIGLLWIRARVRFIFAWFSGTLLIFLSNLMDFSYTGFDGLSPVSMVFGLGVGLVLVSAVLLLYERALHTSIESDIVRGDAHYLKRNYGKALDSYNEALAKTQIKSVEVLGSPMVQYDVPWYSKGSALILMGQVEEGIKCLDMALAINPDNEVTWVNKGNAHTKLGDHETAMECYRRAIETNPFYEIAWNNMGNAHARRKDYLTALKHYNRAIKINSKYDDAWINKGYVLAKMGKPEQAIGCLNHVGSKAKGQIPKMDRDVHSL